MADILRDVERSTDRSARNMGIVGVPMAAAAMYFGWSAATEFFRGYGAGPALTEIAKIQSFTSLLLAGIAALLISALRHVGRGHQMIEQALAQYGDSGTLRSDVNQDLNAGRRIDKIAWAGRQWLLCAPAGRFVALVRWSDLIWHYGIVRTTRVNGMKAGTVGELTLWLRTGKSVVLSGPVAVISDVTGVAAEHAPWAFAGYSEQLKESWNHDRPELVAMVDARKTNLAQGEWSASTSQPKR